MYDRAVLALVFVSALGVAVPSLACEMHQSHATLTTAANTPASPPPVKVSQPQPVQSLPTTTPQPAASAPTQYATGFMHCPQMRAKEQTVYLTD